MSNKYLQLDWLAFTYHSDRRDIEPFEVFKTDFPELENAVLNMKRSSIQSKYRQTFDYLGDIFFSFNNCIENDDKKEMLFVMGVNVQVPSHALASFFKIMGFDPESPTALVDLLKLLKKRNCKLSRIDLCYDDFDKVFTVDYYRKKWALDLIQSPFIRNIQCIGSRSKGFTMYFGSLKKRDKLLRIYDKFLESNGEVDSVRYEFELHADKARAIHDYIVSDKFCGGLDFSHFVVGFFRVKVENKSSNLNMVRDDDEWSNWLYSVYSQDINSPSSELYTDSQENNAFNLNLTHRWDEISEDNRTNIWVDRYGVAHYKLLKIVIPPEIKDYVPESLTYYVERQCMSNVSGYIQSFGIDYFMGKVDSCIKSGSVPKKYTDFCSKRDLNREKNKVFKRERNKLIRSCEFVDVDLCSEKNPFFID